MKNLRKINCFGLLIVFTLLFLIVMPTILNFSSIAATDEEEWDISVDGSNSIIATLTDEGILTIKGSRNYEKLDIRR